MTADELQVLADRANVAASNALKSGNYDLAGAALRIASAAENALDGNGPWPIDDTCDHCGAQGIVIRTAFSTGMDRLGRDDRESEYRCVDYVGCLRRYAVKHYGAQA